MATTGESFDPLPERIRRRILQEGPLTFAAFMEAALYDPTDGFYARPPVGEGPGHHFATSPHVSPTFGMLLASWLGGLWEGLGRPDPFVVIDVGAGDGTLAAQLLEFLPAGPRGVARYIAVERSPGGRAGLDRLADGAAIPVEVLSSLEEAPHGVVAVVVANELLDNLPFHRVRQTEQGLVELFVDVGDGSFRLVARPLSDPALAEVAGALEPGQEAVAHRAADGFVEQAAAHLSRGYVLMFDYGFTGGGRASAPHAYRHHRFDDDVLASPGSRDITAGIDFDRLSHLARGAGHEAWGPVTQRDLLIALGFRGLDQGARQRQVKALAEGNGIEAARIYAARSRATPLVDPSGPGGHLVLCVGVGGVPEPEAVRRAAER
jgi:SAM-dependent MidA family methyltransferase